MTADPASRVGVVPCLGADGVLKRQGLDLTLEFLRDKRSQAERAATFVGLPAMRRQNA